MMMTNLNTFFGRRLSFSLKIATNNFLTVDNYHKSVYKGYGYWQWFLMKDFSGDVSHITPQNNIEDRVDPP